MHQQSDISESLEEYGFALINDFIDTSLIDEYLRYARLRDMRNRKSNNINYSSGSYLRQNTPGETDGHVSRLYMPYKEFRLFSEVRESKIILQAISSYFGRQAYPRVDWLQHNAFPGTLGTPESTRDFHVDIWRTSYSSSFFSPKNEPIGHSQVKAFLYLDDVELKDGPFCFMPNSEHHLSLLSTIPDHYKRYSTGSEYISESVSTMPRLTCCGKAGTLILADVTLLHRGLPQFPGNDRLIYSCSYYDFGGELLLGFSE